MTVQSNSNLRAVSALLFACSASLAAAQPTEPQPERGRGDIVVEGERSGADAAREAARAVVRNSGVIRGDRPIARWREKLCVQVIGIEQPAREIVAQRVLDYADMLGLEAEAKSGCRTNVSIAFTFDATRLIETTRTYQPRSLNEVPSYYEDLLFGNAAPLRAWYRTGWRDRMGRAAAGQQPASVTMTATSWSGMMPNKDDAPITTGHSKSRVQTDGTRAIEAAMIIVDRNLAAGYHVEDVANLVALHALAELYPRDTRNDPNSIMALFAAPADEPRGGLSQCDWSLLRKIYAVQPARSAQFHTSALIRELSKAPDCAADPLEY